jgi:hypothetical protein
MKKISFLRGCKIKISNFNLILFLVVCSTISANGQNYVPILKKNLKYSIFNLNKLKIEKPEEEFDFANPTLSEKYILLGKYENNQKYSCKLSKGLFDTELGKIIFPTKFSDIRVINNKYFEIINCSNEYDFYTMSILDSNLKTIHSEVCSLPNYGLRQINGPFKILKFKNKIKVLDENLNLLFENPKIRQLEYLGKNLFKFSYDDDLIEPLKLYKWGLINKKGQIIIQPIYYGIYNPNESNLIGVENSKHEIGYFNLLGRNIIPFKNQSAFEFTKNGLAIRNDLKEPKNKIFPSSIIVDRRGKIIVKELDSTLNYEEIFNDYILISKIINEEKYFNFKDLKGTLILSNFYKNPDFLNDSTWVGIAQDSTYSLISISKKKSKIFKFPNSTEWLDLIDFENQKIIYLRDENDKNLIFLNSKLEKIETLKLDKHSLPYSINKKYILSNKNNGYQLSKSNGEVIFQGPHGIAEPWHLDSYDKTNDLISYLTKLKNNFIVVRKDFGEEIPKHVWYNINNYIELTEEYFLKNNINLNGK